MCELTPPARTVLDPLSDDGLVRLNIGSGDCPNAGYWNVDADAHACRYAAANGCRAIQAMAHDLPVADASVDVVYASHVLEHLPVLEAPDGVATAADALREWHRVLKPGGFLFVAVPHFERIILECLRNTRTHGDWVLNLFGQPRPGMSHCWAYTAESLTELLEQGGFEIIGHFDCFMFKPDGRHDASGGLARCDDGTMVSISLNLKATKAV